MGRTTSLKQMCGRTLSSVLVVARWACRSLRNFAFRARCSRVHSKNPSSFRRARIRFCDFERWRMVIVSTKTRKSLKGMTFIVPLYCGRIVALFILFHSVNGLSDQMRIDPDKAIYYRCFVEFRYLVVREQRRELM